MHRNLCRARCKKLAPSNTHATLSMHVQRCCQLPAALQQQLLLCTGSCIDHPPLPPHYQPHFRWHCWVVLVAPQPCRPAQPWQPLALLSYRIASCSSVLVAHGSLLESDGWELLGECLHVLTQRLNLWHAVGVEVVAEVLELGPGLLLEVHCRKQGIIECCCFVTLCSRVKDSRAWR